MKRYFWPLIVIVLLLSLVLIILGFSTTAIKNPIPKVSLSDISSNLNPPNFIAIGNITSDGIRGWKLIYEESGKSNLTKLLVFNTSSVCKIANSSFDCSSYTFKDGARARVEGYNENNGELINVYSLTIQP